MEHSGSSVHEAYSFACMRCGHGWEQEFEIRHLEYSDGTPYITYHTEGKRVPSPIKNPTCINCDGHLVRIMQAGRVAGARVKRLPRPARRPANGASPGAP